MMTSGRDRLLCVLLPLALAAAHDSLPTSVLMAQTPHQKTNNDTVASGPLFDEVVVSDNVQAVIRNASCHPAGRQFEILASWVLQENIRLSYGFQSSHDGRVSTLMCPAIELVAATGEAGQLETLKTRIVNRTSLTDRARMATASMLLLIALMDNDINTAVVHAEHMDEFIRDEAVPEEFRSALFVGAWAARSHESLRSAFGAILNDEHSRLLKSWPNANDAKWAHEVATLNGLYKHLAAGRTEPSYGRTPNLLSWFPTSVTTERSPENSWLPTHWRSNNSQVECLSAQHQNLLFYRLPLRGNFEISFETKDYAFQQIEMIYAGQWVVPRKHRRFLSVGNLRAEQGEELETALQKPDAWVRNVITVREGVCSTWINGRKILERSLPDSHDPWLAVRCVSPFHGVMRNVRIRGNPEVLKVVDLLPDEQLDGWVSWFDHFADEWQVQTHPKQTKVLFSPRLDELHGTFAENLLTFQRPMAEDGVIQYEFFYEPGKAMVHPALGRTAFQLSPDGVQHHHVGEAAANAETQSANRRAASALPELKNVLQPGEWNSVKLKLSGNDISIDVNDDCIHQHQLAQDDARTFGLFHYCDQTEVQVRNLYWEGEWASTVPSILQQELADDPLKTLDETRAKLPAIFVHDFTTEGIGSDYFNVDGHGSRSATATPHGVVAECAAPEGTSAAKFSPCFEVHGDFDVILEFDNLLGTGDLETAIRIDVMHGNEGTRCLLSNRVERRIFLGGRMQRQEGEKWQFLTKNLTTEAASGQLRIGRRGDIYTVAFAEAGSANFHVLETQKGSPAPVSAGELNFWLTSASGTSASVVWKKFELSAERLMYHPPGSAAGSKAIFILTLPDDETIIDKNVPLWQQYCRRRMDAYELKAVDQNGDAVERMKEPIMVHRQSDSSKGLVYLWTQNDGRPAAIGTAMLQGDIESGENLTEVDEFHSLHDRPLSMTLQGEQQWNVKKAGLQWYEFSDAPEPATVVSEIYTQASVLSKRFSSELNTRGGHRIPLQDEPIYEYSFTAGDRTLGGILTSFIVDADPEVLLCLEIRKNAVGEFRWHYAGANYAGAAAFLLLDERLVWSESPARFGPISPHRGWFPHRNLNLRDGIAGLVEGVVEKVFDLPDGFNYMGQPEWAYDQKSLVFHRSGPPNGLAGSIMGRLDLETKTLTDIGLGCMPALSPDGKKVVFNRVGSGVMQADSDGQNEEQLDANGWAVGWSPDNNYIVWGKANNCTLMDVATGQKRPLLTPQQSGQIQYLYWNISWSHDSKSVAFNAIHADDGKEILVVADVESPDGFKILFEGNIQPDLTWHPDNERVVFAWDSGVGRKQLYIMHRHHDIVPKLLPGQPPGFRIQDCDWSPDGKKVAFSAILPATSGEWNGKKMAEAEE